MSGLKFWSCKQCGAVVGITEIGKPKPETPMHDDWHVKLDEIEASLRSLGEAGGLKLPPRPVV